MYVQYYGPSYNPTTCACLYPTGMVPNADALPDYATRSAPKFYLTSSSISGKALGMSSGYDCTSDTISITAQTHVKSTRQQFHLSYHHQLVSATCPKKVLSADCTTGMLVLRDSAYGQQGAQHQWNTNSADGSITYNECPELKLSSVKDSLSTPESFYFHHIE